ncbi:putative amidase AmiB1 [Mycobacteroides abscessus subsp. abscessus]|nr:putative amidase AmiB1 [Mycobacteroides abscessus subsp. abscessus]
MVEGAKMLARTVIRLAEDEAERSRVLDRLARRTVKV